MPVVFIRNTDTSPWSRPGDWNDSGHTIEMLGAGGNGGTGAGGSNAQPSSGGSGGAYVKLAGTVTGALGSTTPFRVSAASTDTASNTNFATLWESATFANCYYAESGQAGRTAGTNVPGGNSANRTTGSPSPVTYGTLTGNNGGSNSFIAGGSSYAGGTGGGGAGGPNGAGAGSNGTNSISTAGGTGGGGANGGGAVSFSTTSDGLAGGTNRLSQAGGAGGTTSSRPGGNASNGGAGGGGGRSDTTVQTAPGGTGAQEVVWTRTSDSLTAGPGGGGGGGGGCSLNATGHSGVGGAGGGYGSGGGGGCAARSATSTRTGGAGGPGIIVATYAAANPTGTGTPAAQASTVSGSGVSSSTGAGFRSPAPVFLMHADGADGSAVFYDDAIKTPTTAFFEGQHAGGNGGYAGYTTRTVIAGSARGTSNITFDNAFGATSNSWQGLTVRQIIPVGYRSAAAGGWMRIKIKTGTGNSGAKIAATHVGFAAASGDPYDFDGTQVHVGWSAAGIGGAQQSLADSTVYTSDWFWLPDEPNRNLIVSIYFANVTAVNLMRATGLASSISYYAIPGDHAAETNANPGWTQTASASLVAVETSGHRRGPWMRISFRTYQDVISANLDNCFVGFAAATGNVYDFDGGQVRVKWNGSNGIQKLTGLGTLYTSDWFYFPDDNSKTLVASFAWSGANMALAGLASSNCTRWYFAGDVAGTTDVTADGGGDAVSQVERIETGGHQITPSGSAQLDTAQSKFGGASFYEPPSTDSKIMLDGSSDFAFGVGDFTIDFWARATADSLYSFIDFSPHQTGGSGWPNIGYRQDWGTLLFYSGDVGPLITDAYCTFTANTWHHVAATRQGGNLRLFFDGVKVGSTVTDNTDYKVGPYRPLIGGSGYWNGDNGTQTLWFDEVRIIKGAAAWTESFTPPTRAYIGRPLLLMHCDGRDQSREFIDAAFNQTITPHGNARISSLPKFGSASAYFAGTGPDYLTIDGTDFDFGTEDFTAELWFKFETTSLGVGCFFFDWGGTANAPWLIYEAGVGHLRWHTAAGNVISVAWTPDTNWHHLAITRAADTTRMFLDGTIIGTDTRTPENLGVSNWLLIGVGNDSATGPMKGWMDEIRIIKGYAAYTRNFTVPSVAYGTSWPAAQEATVSGVGVVASVGRAALNVVPTLLMHFEGGDADTDFVDSSPANRAITRIGAVQIDTAQSKFGGSSLYTDNTGGTDTAYLTVAPSSDFAFGTGDWTVDFWYKPNSTLASSVIYAYASTPAFGAVAITTEYRVVRVIGYTYGIMILGTVQMPFDQWSHVAVTCASGQMRLFVNGVQDGPTFDLSGYSQNWTDPQIGGGTWTGWIDELRVIKGFAQWVSTFTPPPAPYPQGRTNDLLLRFDDADGATTFVDYSTGPLTADNILGITQTQGFMSVCASQDGKRIFINDQGTNCKRSADGGATWSAPTTFGSYAVQCSEDGTKLVGDSGNTIRYSTDSGATFTVASATPSAGNLPRRIYLSGDGSTILATIEDETAGHQGRLYISTNNGTSWTQKTPKTGERYNYVCCSRNGQHIYVQSYSDDGNHNRLHVSHDYGATFAEAIDVGWGTSQVVCSPEGKHVWFTNSNITRISHDYGVTWDAAAVTMNNHYYGVTNDGRVMFYYNNGGYLGVSQDGGQTFDRYDALVPSGGQVPVWLTDIGLYILSRSGQPLVLLRRNKVIGFGNAQIDNAQSKFGGTAALFDGTGDYLALAATAWTPRELGSNLVAWYDDIGPFTLVSGKVSVWSDKSGNVHDAIQATDANRPTKGTVTVGFGGTVAGLTVTSPPNGYDICVVATPISTTLNGDNYRTLVGAGGNANHVLLDVGGTSGRVGTYTLTGFGWTSSLIWNTSAHICYATVPQPGGNNIKMALDGSALQDTGKNDPVSSYLNTLGNYSAGGQPQGFGDLYEVVVLPVGASNTIKQQVEGYLAWKWGLALPGSHPYYATSPKLSSLNLDFGTADFTVEFWCRPTVINTYAYLIDTRGAGENSPGDALSIRQTVDNFWEFCVFGADAFAGGTVTVNTWHHIAATRRNGVLRGFVNGVEVGSRTIAGNLACRNFFIGSASNLEVGTGGAFFTGWVDDLRVIRAYAAYERDFALPIVPQSTTLFPGSAVVSGTGSVITQVRATGQSADFILHFDGADASTTIIDSARGHTVTASGTTQIDTAKAKFGVSSVLLPGASTSDYLEIASTSDNAFGTGDFTIDCWVWDTNLAPALRGIYDGGARSSNLLIAPQLFIRDGYLRFGRDTNLTGEIIASEPWQTGEWVHVAVARLNGITRLYQNGFMVGQFADTNNYVVTDLARIGKVGSGTEWVLNGWIDEFRITKGFALYGPPFTPPTAAHVVFQAQTSAVAGTGAVTYTPITGTGAVSAQASAVAASGTSRSTGTGTPAAQTSTVAGSGTSRSTSSSATVAAQASTVAGAGPKPFWNVTGVLNAQAATVASTGTSRSTGTGTPAAQNSTVAGAGVSASTSTAGALAAQAAAVSGAGSVGSQPITGTGTPAAQAASVAGAGTSASTGIGTPAAQSATVAGAGVTVSTGTGTLAGQSATVAATGTSRSTGTGVAAAQGATVSGTGTTRSTGTGNPSATAAAVAGSGTARSTGTGTPAAQSATVAGVANAQFVATGVLAAQAATVAGSGTSSCTGTGVLQAGASTVAGIAQTPGSAILLAQAATVAGVGITSSTGTSTAAAQPATVAGVGATISSGTATLAAQPAMVAGTAALVTSGTGVLQAGASTVVGLTGPSTGTGTPSAGVAAIAASGTSSTAATGDLATSGSVVAGVGISGSTGTGTLIVHAAEILGADAHGDGDLFAQSSIVVGVGAVLVHGAPADPRPGTGQAQPRSPTGQAQSRSAGAAQPRGASFPANRR